MLDNFLLFIARKLKVVKSSISAKKDTFCAFIKYPILDVKGCSSSLVALELARIIGLKCKLNSPSCPRNNALYS
jgi:hypothetical protein